jgi:plastocyanin
VRRLLAAALALLLVVPVAGAGAAHRKRHRMPPLRHDERVTWTPPAPAPKPLGHLQLVAREYSLTPSRTKLAAGRVSIELDNFGQDPHDLRVERVDGAAPGFSFALAKPRTVSTRQFELGPGAWKLYCSLPGHEALGMRTTITVAG